MTLAVLFGLLPGWSGPTQAQQHRFPGGAAPVIVAGREAEVLGLFRPYELGGDVMPDWSLYDVAIREREIEITLRGPSGREATIELLPRNGASGPEATASFRIALRASGEAERRVTQRLADAVRANDQGGFWTEAPRLHVFDDPPPGITPPEPSPLDSLRRQPHARFLVVLAIDAAFLLFCFVAWLVLRRRRSSAP